MTLQLLANGWQAVWGDMVRGPPAGRGPAAPPTAGGCRRTWGTPARATRAARTSARTAAPRCPGGSRPPFCRSRSRNAPSPTSPPPMRCPRPTILFARPLPHHPLRQAPASPSSSPGRCLWTRKFGQMKHILSTGGAILPGLGAWSASACNASVSWSFRKPTRDPGDELSLLTALLHLPSCPPAKRSLTPSRDSASMLGHHQSCECSCSPIFPRNAIPAGMLWNNYREQALRWRFLFARQGPGVRCCFGRLHPYTRHERFCDGGCRRWRSRRAC